MAPDLDVVGSTTPVEAMVLDRDVMIQLVRTNLHELHDERRRLAGTPAHDHVVQRIRYLDEVLGWVKEQGGRELVLLNRRL